MHNIFNTELTYIKDERIRKSLITILNKLPEYFYEIETSSTGKYHPAFSSGKQGLIRHTKAAIRIAVELMNNESLQNFNQNEKDLIIFSLMIHDGLKCGKIKSQYTAFDHPILIANLVKENEENLELTKEEIDFICRCVKTHMGPWTTDYRGNEILEAPKDKYQRFVHMCDYLSSRKFLDIKFENNEIVD